MQPRGSITRHCISAYPKLQSVTKHCTLQGPQISLVRDCEKFIPAHAQPFCLALPGSCVTSSTKLICGLDGPLNSLQRIGQNQSRSKIFLLGPYLCPGLPACAWRARSLRSSGHFGSARYPRFPGEFLMLGDGNGCDTIIDICL